MSKRLRLRLLSAGVCRACTLRPVGDVTPATEIKATERFPQESGYSNRRE